jgi:hypothetical protein
MWFADIPAINDCLEYFSMPFPDSLARQLDRARTYLRTLTRDPAAIAAMVEPEILAPGGAKVIRTVGTVV